MSSLSDVGRGFRDFLLRGSILDLAVAVVVGAAFTAIITSLVENLLTPLIAAVAGQPSFDGLVLTANGSAIRYGAFLTAVINFALIAAALYFLVVLPMGRVAAARARRSAVGASEAPAAPPTDEAILLTEIRDLLRTRD